MGRGRRRKQSTHTNELLIKQTLRQALLKFVLLNSEFSLLYHSLPCPLSFPRSLHFTSNSSNKEESITRLNLNCRGGGLGEESPWCGHQKLQYFLIWFRLKPCPKFHAGSVAEKNRNAKQRVLPRCNSEVKPYPSLTHPTKCCFGTLKVCAWEIIKKTPNHPGLSKTRTCQQWTQCEFHPNFPIPSHTCGQQHKRIEQWTTKQLLHFKLKCYWTTWRSHHPDMKTDVSFWDGMCVEPKNQPCDQQTPHPGARRIW